MGGFIFGEGVKGRGRYAVHMHVGQCRVLVKILNIELHCRFRKQAAAHTYKPAFFYYRK